MPSTVKGVIARAKGAPVEVVDVIVPDPGPGEAVVRIQACGVCHTDLHYREGGINDEFPFLLGHEAAGVVEAVGEGVTDVAAGDFVILNWRAVCGQCRACAKGKPQYCFNTHNATQKMTLTDGTELSPALGIGAFIEKTLVHAGQCTKVDPADLLRHGDSSGSSVRWFPQPAMPALSAWPVVPRDERDADAVVAVPHLAAPALGDEVRADLLPRLRRRLVPPVRHGDAHALARGLDPQVAGLFAGQPLHRRGHRRVAAVVVGAHGCEDHRDVRRRRGRGDRRIGHPARMPECAARAYRNTVGP